MKPLFSFAYKNLQSNTKLENCLMTRYLCAHDAAFAVSELVECLLLGLSRYMAAAVLGLGMLTATLALAPTDEVDALNEQALRLSQQDKYEEAESLLKRALAIMEKAYGPEDPKIVGSINNIAHFYYAHLLGTPAYFIGRMVEAEPFLKRALAIMEKAYVSQHPEIVGSLNDLADFYQAIEGREAEAEPFLKRGLTIMENTYGPEHPDIVGSLDKLADFYAGVDRHAAAELTLKRCLTIMEKTYGPEHPQSSVA